jgi:hypothetical protein
LNIKTVRVALISCFLLFYGCASVPDLASTDRTQEVIQLVRDRGLHDMGCEKLSIERPARRDLVGAWPVLSSEYKVWIRGCGKEARYRVLCRSEEPCMLDQNTKMPLAE